MQITGATTSPSIFMGKINSSPAPKPAQDQAVMNVSADSFSSLVKAANAFPEVRSDVVDSFKARIQSGAYPTQDDVSGLADVIGSHIVQAANSDSASQ